MRRDEPARGRLICLNVKAALWVGKIFAENNVGVGGEFLPEDKRPRQQDRQDQNPEAERNARMSRRRWLVAGPAAGNAVEQSRE